MPKITLQEYEERRQKLSELFRARGHGSQAQASYDTRIHPATISGILSGRVIDFEKLEILEEWIERGEN